MHPILLKLGPLNVYSYGVMVALGFALATAFVYMRAPTFGIDRDNVVDLMILMLVSGIVGARLFYILQNIGYYCENPYEIPNLSKGGLVWYGAFITGLGSAAAYIRIKKMDFWESLDLAAPYIALAQAVGRIGCFMNGCCYGTAMADGTLHPTQLYSAASLIFIFVILRIWQDHRHFKSEIFLGYCVLYSSKRFLVEFMRGDNPRIFFGFTISQVISCIVFVISLGTLIAMAAAWKKKK
jgi:phosphatidylglycerol---prolipoprotein diacylglyceryl transferase